MNRQFAGASEIVEFESAQSAMQSELSGGPGKKKKKQICENWAGSPTPPSNLATLLLAMCINKNPESSIMHVHMPTETAQTTQRRSLLC